MKNKGFTLIELLAVIVILAIIALIATPIILGIINDVREESNKRSIELYASSVRNSIAAYQLTNSKPPKTFSDLTVEYKGDVECSIKELYSDGSFYLEGCKVNKSENEYSYGAKKEITAKLSEVCALAPDSEEAGLNMGAKYNCKVDPNKEPYTFYVLSVEEDSVNLIMDSNIRTGGEPVKEENPTEEQYGYVAWNSEDYVDGLGPFTAMEYLQEATSGWTNVNKQTIDTFPISGVPFEMEKTFIVNARLPYFYDEVLQTGCIYGLFESCPLWMVGYLYHDELVHYNENIPSVTLVLGYWALDGSNIAAGLVNNLGTSTFNYLGDAAGFGVRPVINLSI